MFFSSIEIVPFGRVTLMSQDMLTFPLASGFGLEMKISV